MQNTFVKVHRYIGGFSRNAAFSTWLYKVTHHCINEYFSKAARHTARRLPLNDEYTLAGADAQAPYEAKQLVEKVMAQLNETERFLLTAREVEGASYEELAEIMGATEGALRVRMARLKADIREKLEKMDKGWAKGAG
jgi:RNA polymerase sigma-70 factor (ECF subfamily)